MRKSDLIRSALGGLWRQKARTSLTLLGVAVGSCALAFSLSLGLGLRGLIDNEFRSRDDFWWVTVFPANRGQPIILEKDIPPEKLAVKGEMPEERRQRIRAKLIEDYRRTTPSRDFKLVTQEKIDRLKALPDVEEVRVYRFADGEIWLGEKSALGRAYAGRLDFFDPDLAKRLTRGRLADAPNEAVVTEYQLYCMGVRTDAELDAVLGKPVRVVLGKKEFEKAGLLAGLLTPGTGQVEEAISRGQAATLTKIAEQLPKRIDEFDLTPEEKILVKLVMARKRTEGATKRGETMAAAEYAIVGVLRDTTPEEEAADPFSPHKMRGTHTQVFLTAAGGERLHSQFPELASLGYSEAFVKVRAGGDLPAVVDGVKADGLDCYSGLKFYQSVKREVTLIAAGLNLFALISLLVAAIGITNTLFTSVLERTREIGIWKSLGARDSQILLMFLSEGTVLGILGGSIGLLLAWLLSIPGDSFVRGLIQAQSQEKILSTSVFEFPLWLCLGTVGFALVITTGAALYPARRASRVQPVEALRHE
jgi:putative ABC transport system permease protein